MPKSTREIREEVGQIVAKMEKLTESVPMSAEARQEWDGLNTQQKELREIVQMREQTEAIGATFRDQGHRQEEQTENRNGATPEQRYTQAYYNFLRQGLSPNQHGFTGISQEDRSVLMPKRAELTQEERTTLSGVFGSGGQGAYPGATSGFYVPVDFIRKIDEAQKFIGGFMTPGVAEEITTSTGAPLPYPTDNDTGNVGELVGEGVQVATQAPTISAVFLGAYKFSSKLVPVSFELAQDSAFDMPGYLAKKFGLRLGRIKNQKFTIGVGTTEPSGIITGATAGITATGDDNQTSPDKTTQVGYIDLINLEHSVDPMYRQNAKFMLHDTTLAFIKTLKDKYGRPLWMPSMTSGAPATINGYPYIVNNDMASTTQTSPATARKTVLFGDFSKYLIRRVQEMRVLRLDERYADYGVIGFLAFERADGALIDAGTHPVKYITNPAS